MISSQVKSLFLMLLIGALLSGAGCQPVIEALPLEEITGQETSTPTPNLTLLAVARMLTATAAVPTPTTTHTFTPTLETTATATTEVILEGSQKKPAPAGVPFRLGNLTLHVLDSQLAGEVGRLKAQEGHTYLDLELLLKNEGDQPISYTPFYLLLVGADEESYQPAVDSLHPGLLGGTLRAGEQVRGHVAFAIPESEADGGAGGDFTLVLRPELSDLPPETGLREAWIALSPPGEDRAGLPETGDPPGWPPAGLPEPGRWIEASGVGLSVDDIAFEERVSFGRAARGNHFVVVNVQIDNVDHLLLPYNPLYFRVKDQAGYEYPPTAGAPESSLQAGSLRQGQEVSGQLIFETPLDAGDLVLSYQPTSLFQDYEEIRVLIQAQ